MSAPARIRAQLERLGLQWPEPPPTHEFVRVARFGELAFVSGHAPYLGGTFRYLGRVGDDIDLDTAQQAAALAVLGCLSSLDAELGGLDRLARIVKLNGYVRCAPTFIGLPAVTDGASRLLIELFGEDGRHARTTVGVTSLPQGVVVECELVVAVRHRAD
jgi:enamine deaminase RidA (YjgF/YER057c/UK114 family)